MKPARGAFGANWAKLPGVNTHSVKIPKFPLKYSPITFISKIYQNLYFYLYGDTECSINLVDICAVGYTSLASIIHQWRQFYFIFLSVSTLNLIYIYQVAPWRGQLEKKRYVTNVAPLSACVIARCDSANFRTTNLLCLLCFCWTISVYHFAL